MRHGGRDRLHFEPVDSWHAAHSPRCTWNMVRPTGSACNGLQAGMLASDWHHVEQSTMRSLPPSNSASATKSMLQTSLMVNAILRQASSTLMPSSACLSANAILFAVNLLWPWSGLQHTGRSVTEQGEIPGRGHASFFGQPVVARGCLRSFRGQCGRYQGARMITTAFPAEVVKVDVAKSCSIRLRF